MGGCGSHIRAPQSAPTSRHPSDEIYKGMSLGTESSLQITFGLPPSPELTSIDKGTDVHISPSTTPPEDKKTLSVSKSYLCQMWPDDEQKLESSIKIDTEDLQTENKRSGSATVTVDDNWTSTPNSPAECTTGGKIETEGNTANPQQPENFGVEFTSLPLGMVAQLRKLARSGNSESKAIAEELLEWISKRPPENRKQCPVRSLMSMSLDLNICLKESNVNITSEPVGGPKLQIWSSNSSYGSAEGETYVPCKGNLFKLSTDESWGSEIASEPFSGGEAGGEGSTMKLNQPADEKEKKMIRSHDEMIKISKMQFKRSRRKSKMMSDFLKEMPSLTQSLATSKTMAASRRKHRSKRSSVQNETRGSQEDILLASMTSKIDMLDEKISESTVKLTELRRKSLDLLTDGGDSDENGNHLAYLNVEREINRLQANKNKLVDERDQIVTELHSKLIDKISSTPLIACPIARNRSFCIDPQVRDSSLERDRLSSLERDRQSTLERNSRILTDAEAVSDYVASGSFSPMSTLSPRLKIASV